jgi:hypothetical protein
MSNPVPPHNPTDGLSSACFVQLSGTGVIVDPKQTRPPSANYPNAGHYEVTLSVSGANGLASSVVITPSLVDVSNTAYASTAASWVYRSYNDPQVTEASLPTGPGNPTNLAPKPTQTAKLASVSASGASTVTVTALSPGKAIVSAIYPTFDNAEGNVTVGNLGGPLAGTTVPKDYIFSFLDVKIFP